MLHVDGYSSELSAARALLPTLRLYSTCGAFITFVLCSLLQNLALFKACERGDASRVKELLSLGASVNYRNDARVSCRSYMYILRALVVVDSHVALTTSECIVLWDKPECCIQ